MTTLADKSLLSGGDNKPPMLEKHLYDSWKSRMELYMMNRPHGRMILASVEKGIPPEIYALVSQHRVAKDIWEKIQLLMQGTSLTKQEREFKLVKDLHTTNVDQIHAHLEQHERHANELMDLDTYDSDSDELTLPKFAFSMQIYLIMFICLLLRTCNNHDSNIIPYSQYVIESQQAAVQNSNSSAQQDVLILSVIEQLKTQVANCTKINLENKCVNDTLTAELETQRTNYVNSLEPTLSSRPTKVEVPKELPKVSMVNTSLKKLKHHLVGFDVVVKERTTSTAITEGSWGFKHTKAYFRDEIIQFAKALKDLFNTFNQYLVEV
ncbi:hypothetical protein Tco_0341040 [Tanacetum coccineum]